MSADVPDPVAELARMYGIADPRVEEAPEASGVLGAVAEAVGDAVEAVGDVAAAGIEQVGAVAREAQRSVRDAWRAPWDAAGDAAGAARDSLLAVAAVQIVLGVGLLGAGAWLLFSPAAKPVRRKVGL